MRSLYSAVKRRRFGFSGTSDSGADVIIVMLMISDSFSPLLTKLGWEGVANHVGTWGCVESVQRSWTPSTPGQIPQGTPTDVNTSALGFHQTPSFDRLRQMSLDIGLAVSKTTEPYPAMAFSLDDDGYYWFCYPFFEDLHDRTGEMIDLYGGAWFSGTLLDELAATLSEIRAKATEMPEEWQVCVGHSVGSKCAPKTPQPLFSLIHRDPLLRLLARFEDLLAEARREAKWVACLGD